jgi:ankyrin repeat protein
MRILERVPKRSSHLVRQTLQVLAFANPELSAVQLCQLLSISEDDNHVEISAMITLDEVSRACGSLVRISQYGDGGGGGDDYFFEFAHFSVREFLESRDLLHPDPRLYSNHLSEYAISEPGCRRFLADRCLRFLQFETFNKGFTVPWGSPEIYNIAAIGKTKFPLYSYAAIHWMALARNQFNDEVIFSLAKRFFDPCIKPCFLLWATILQWDLIHTVDQNEDVFRLPDRTINADCHCILIAAALGFAEICSFLLETSTNTSFNSQLGTPLECAVGGVFFLFGYGGVHDHRHGRAQVCYDTGWNQGVVCATLDCLLANPATSKRPPPSSNGTSLLSLALHNSVYLNGFETFIKMHLAGEQLVETDLDAFHQAADSWRGLSSAEPAFLRLVQHLNQYVSTSPVVFQLCVLVWERAMKEGLAFAKNSSLVDTRISLSERNLRLEAISAVTRDDFNSIEKILQDPRLDPTNVVSEQGAWTLLHIAVMKASAPVVKLLLVVGCSVVKTDEFQYIPVDRLIDREHSLNGAVEILRLLLAYGSPTISRQGSRPCVWFTQSAELLRVLLELESAETLDEALRLKTDYQLDQSLTPLALACRFSNAEVAAALAAPTFDVWKRYDVLDSDVFQNAAMGGSEAIVQVLLDAGFRPTTSPGAMQNEWPLSYIGTRASGSCVRLLKNLCSTTQGAADIRRCQQPLKLYLSRCLKARPPICPCADVIKELSTGLLNGEKSSTRALLWEAVVRELRSELAALPNDPNLFDTVRKYYNDAIKEVMKASGMFEYETETQSCGILPIISAIDDSGEGTIYPFCTDAISVIINESAYWTEAKTSDPLIRLLKHSVLYEKPRMISLLLEKGVSVHQRLGGLSALELSCQLGFHDFACFKMLLDHSDIGRIDNLDEMPGIYGSIGLLHWLAHSDAPAAPLMLAELLKRGANPNLASSLDRQTPLVYHLFKKKFHTAQILLDYKADLALRTAGGGDAALAAAAGGAVRFLVSLAALVDDGGRSFDWNNTMRITCYCGETGFAVEGVSAMHLAALNGWVVVMDFYYDKGFLTDVDLKSQQELTPMHLAAMYGRPNAITWLFKKGGTINCRSSDLSLPLHLAVRSSHVAAVKVLLELGSEQTPDRRGMWPLSYAMKNKHDELIDCLQEALRSENTVRQKSEAIKLSHRQASFKPLVRGLEEAIRDGSLHACQDVRRMGCPLDTYMPGCRCCSPFQFAAAMGKAKIARWLLDEGASINSTRCDIHGFWGPMLNMLTVYIKFNAALEQFLDRYLDEGLQGFELTGNPFVIPVISGNIKAMAIINIHIKKNKFRYGLVNYSIIGATLISDIQ